MTTDDVQPDFFSIIDFAKKLNLHPNTIRRLVKKGKISAIRICTGKRTTYRIPKTEIDRIALFDLEEMIDKIIEQRRCQCNPLSQKNN